MILERTINNLISVRGVRARARVRECVKILMLHNVETREISMYDFRMDHKQSYLICVFVCVCVRA